MRPIYDDFEEFAFADNAAVRRLLSEQRREEQRLASRKPYSHEEDDYLDDLENYSEIEEFSEYDEDEFDEYSGLNFDH